MFSFRKHFKTDLICLCDIRPEIAAYVAGIHSKFYCQFKGRFSESIRTQNLIRLLQIINRFYWAQQQRNYQKTKRYHWYLFVFW